MDLKPIVFFQQSGIEVVDHGDSHQAPRRVPDLTDIDEDNEMEFEEEQPSFHEDLQEMPAQFFCAFDALPPYSGDTPQPYIESGKRVLSREEPSLPPKSQGSTQQEHVNR